MAEPDYVIRQNDSGQTITATATNSTGAAVSITSAEVHFVVSPIAGGEAIVDAVASNLDNGSSSTRGQMAYTWVSDDTAESGFYLGSWRVIYTNGDVQTFPNDRYILIYITPRL